MGFDYSSFSFKPVKNLDMEFKKGRYVWTGYTSNEELMEYRVHFAKPIKNVITRDAPFPLDADSVPYHGPRFPVKINTTIV